MHPRESRVKLNFGEEFFKFLFKVVLNRDFIIYIQALKWLETNQQTITIATLSLINGSKILATNKFLFERKRNKGCLDLYESDNKQSCVHKISRNVMRIQNI